MEGDSRAFDDQVLCLSGIGYCERECVCLEEPARLLYEQRVRLKDAAWVAKASKAIELGLELRGGMRTSEDLFSVTRISDIEKEENLVPGR
jgi:hypothetical protein